MCPWLRSSIGFLVSVVVGQLALWLLIEKILWPRICAAHNLPAKRTGSLTWLLGMTERFLYTGALIIGAPQWIGIWLAMKVAIGWRTAQKRESPSDNLWLIGTALSVVFGFCGAWIALG